MKSTSSTSGCSSAPGARSRWLTWTMLKGKVVDGQVSQEVETLGKGVRRAEVAAGAAGSSEKAEKEQ